MLTLQYTLLVGMSSPETVEVHDGNCFAELNMSAWCYVLSVAIDTGHQRHRSCQPVCLVHYDKSEWRGRCQLWHKSYYKTVQICSVMESSFKGWWCQKAGVKESAPSFNSPMDEDRMRQVDDVYMVGVSALSFLQCFDTVVWVTGRTTIPMIS